VDEIEVKLRIVDRADFERLLSVLPPPRRRIVQLNVYIDTADGSVKRHVSTLRLRVTRDDACMTLKRRIGTSAGHTWRSTEVNVPIDREAAVTWCLAGHGFSVPDVPEMEDVVAAAGGRELRAGTWSRTIRHVCDLSDDLALEVDETLYPDGTVDFEVEVEHGDPALALEAVRRVAAAANVSLRRQPATKHARARAHLAPGPIPIPGENDDR
jgi:uncharacterized protein YjbK